MPSVSLRREGTGMLRSLVELSFTQLVEQLKALGVRRAGVLLVPTSFKAVRPVEGGPLGLIGALRAARAFGASVTCSPGSVRAREIGAEIAEGGVAAFCAAGREAQIESNASPVRIAVAAGSVACASLHGYALARPSG